MLGYFVACLRTSWLWLALLSRKAIRPAVGRIARDGANSLLVDIPSQHIGPTYSYIGSPSQYMFLSHDCQLLENQHGRGVSDSDAPINAPRCTHMFAPPAQTAAIRGGEQACWLPHCRENMCQRKRGLDRTRISRVSGHENIEFQGDFILIRRTRGWGRSKTRRWECA